MTTLATCQIEPSKCDNNASRQIWCAFCERNWMSEYISKLAAYDKTEEQWRVVIETPKGSHNKYKFDETLGLFLLHDVLPEGMGFPYDFGFIPSTLGDDGDPLDVLLLMDQPAFCGCLVPARLIGVIEAQQTETDGTSERNDRLVAVPAKARDFSDCKSVKDLNRHRLDEIEQFFVTYNRLHGKKFKLLGLHGAGKAQTLAHAGIAQYSKRHKTRERKTAK
jgi:inorganic pyrophosphatase